MANPAFIVKVAVKVVEQERGLELQIIFPEFTLATMLPMVIVIEAAKFLRRELFSARFDVKDSDPVRDLKKEAFSRKLDARLREPVNDLKIEFLSARVETWLSEPLNVLNSEP